MTLADGFVTDNNDSDYRRVLEGRLARVSAESDSVRAQIEQAQRQLGSLDAERRHLEALLGIVRGEQPGGQALAADLAGGPADLVVRLLQHEGQPMHYREIARRFQQQGWPLPKSPDSANALLAHFFNDSRLYRPQRGTYALRPAGTHVTSVGTRTARRPRR